MSYLTCPSCRLKVSAAAASSPFHNCPRCLLRDNAQIVMVTTTEGPRRFSGRAGVEFERIVEAKARLSGPARGASSA